MTYHCNNPPTITSSITEYIFVKALCELPWLHIAQHSDSTVLPQEQYLNISFWTETFSSSLTHLYPVAGMGLVDLPNELLFTILESLSPLRLKDLYSLIRVNRRLSNLVIPHLNNLAATEQYRINALLWAAAIRNERMIRFLVERGAGCATILRRHPPQCLETSDRHRKSNEEVVQLVLQKGPNLIVTTRGGDFYGWEASAISHAATMGYNTLTMLLLEKGVNVVMKDSRGETLLHSASHGRGITEASIRRIVELGANVDELSNDGLTPLHCAAQYGSCHIIKALLENGADPMIKNSRGYNAFYRALYGYRPLIPLIPVEEWNGTKRQEAIRVLFKYGSIEFKDWKGNSGLHLAAFTNDRELAEVLLRKGIKVDARECQRRTPLHFAASSSSTTVAAVLLENNANMGARDLHGNTPLHCAAVCGHSGIVRILVEAGADKSIRDNNGNTPLHLAARSKHTGVVRLLLWKDASLGIVNNCGTTVLHIAAKWGDVVMVRMFLEKGSDLASRDKDGNTPLLLAAKYGHVVVVKYLLDNGADIAVRDSRGRGIPEWVVEEVLHHPDRCVMEMPNISLVNRLRREKDKGDSYKIARDFWDLGLC